MTRKRDYILEIRDYRSRRGDTSRLFARLSKLLTELDRAGGISDELMRYFPVAIVACLETYTRITVQELVDAGPPFSDRVEDAGNRQINLFEMMKEIHGWRITFGELLARLTPVNSFADMQQALNPLIAVDIVEVVKSSEADVGDLIGGVEAAFRLRHIYAHEFPAAGAVDRPFIARAVRAAAAFLSALDKGIVAIAFSQSAMNRQTVQQLEEIDDELGLLVRNLSDGLGEKQAALLAKAQKAWRIARDHTAHVMADLEAEGGSMWKMVYNRFAATMTRNRLQELQDLQQLRW